MSELPVISVVVPSFNQGASWSRRSRASSTRVPAGRGHRRGRRVVRRQRLRSSGATRTGCCAGGAAPTAGRPRRSRRASAHCERRPGRLAQLGRLLPPRRALDASPAPTCRHPGFGLLRRQRPALPTTGSSQSVLPPPPRAPSARPGGGLDYVLQPATFFSRRAWQEAGGLDPGLRYCLDWDLILRIAAQPSGGADQRVPGGEPRVRRDQDRGRRLRRASTRSSAMTARHSGRALDSRAPCTMRLETAIDLQRRQRAALRAPSTSTP